jgi:uncharacterized protein
LIAKGAIHVHHSNDDELNRMTELMARYEDTPMDFADASLVVLAERTGIKTVFTFDSDFAVYRINGKDPFELIPPYSP